MTARSTSRRRSRRFGPRSAGRAPRDLPADGRSAGRARRARLGSRAGPRPAGPVPAPRAGGVRGQPRRAVPVGHPLPRPRGAARTCPPAEGLFAIQGLGSYPILLAGTEAQKQRWLPALARGETAPAFALTEPEAGSDAAAIATRAEKHGDGWILTGAKRFISNAPAAGLYVVFARSGPAGGPGGYRPSSVPRDTPGLERYADAHPRPARPRGAPLRPLPASPSTTCWATRARAGASPWGH